MSNKILTTKLILTFFLIFLGTLTLLKFASGTSYYQGYATQSYAYNRPSYATQYNYGYNNYNYGYNQGQNNQRHYLPYVMSNPWRVSAAANYVGGYGSYGLSPYLQPGTPDKFGSVNFNGYNYRGDAVSDLYYRNPWLLEPRRMNNQARYNGGLDFWTPY